MSGLRTPAAVRRVAVAAVAGAGVALTALSIAGITSIDANLRAATPAPDDAAPRHELRLNFEGQPVHDCPRPRHAPGWQT